MGSKLVAFITYGTGEAVWVKSLSSMLENLNNYFNCYVKESHLVNLKVEQYIEINVIDIV